MLAVAPADPACNVSVEACDARLGPVAAKVASVPCDRSEVASVGGPKSFATRPAVVKCTGSVVVRWLVAVCDESDGIRNAGSAAFAPSIPACDESKGACAVWAGADAVNALVATCPGLEEIAVVKAGSVADGGAVLGPSAPAPPDAICDTFVGRSDSEDESSGISPPNTACAGLAGTSEVRLGSTTGALLDVTYAGSVRAGDAGAATEADAATVPIVACPKS